MSAEEKIKRSSRKTAAVGILFRIFSNIHRVSIRDARLNVPISPGFKNCIDMKKGKLFYAALAANILMVILETIGLVMVIIRSGISLVQFYTEDSNLFAFAASLLFCIYAFIELAGGRKIPSWIITVRYMASSCVALTFVVVIFVLIPMSGFENAMAILTDGSMLYHHLLCPILAVVSFVFLEDKSTIGKRQLWLSLMPTALYALPVVILNAAKVMYGPYPFLHIYEQPVWMSIIWAAVIFGMAFLLSFLLYLPEKRRRKKNERIKGSCIV